MRRIVGLSLLSTFALLGCGGGSSSNSTLSTSTDSTSTSTSSSTTSPATANDTTQPEGLWRGTTSTGRTIFGLTLNDGTFWVIYSIAGNSAVIGGAVQGTGTSSNGTFTSTDAKEFNFEGLGILSATVSGSFAQKQSFNGTLTYPTLSNTQVTYTSTYDTGYDQTPSLTSLAGVYNGSSSSAAGAEAVAVSISSSGSVAGIGASGCTFSGSATPRAKGNVYDLSVTFGGGVCANGTATVTGVAYFDAATKQLTSAALNAAKTGGFIYVGTKP